MGGVNSCWTPRYRNPNMCRENHTSTPKVKGHRRNLSAAFNLAEVENAYMNVEMLNINLATEEELMTLPGINRTTAQNIVDYRRQIGGFKKVEDLALVSGVGATKLNQIRMEITVGRKKSSQSSSRSSSRNDLSMQDNVSSSSKRSHFRCGGNMVKVNLNTSNVFQLMKVKEITQTIGENIVVYRDKKGPFKSIDDLVKVKGMRPAILSAIRPYLCLNQDQDTRKDPDVVPHLANGPVTNSSLSQQSYANSSSGISVQQQQPPQTQQDQQQQHQLQQQHRQQQQEESPQKQSNNNSIQARPQLTRSQDDLLSTYGPLLRKSYRKPRLSPIVLRKDNQRVLRVAAWNLQNLSVDKAENPGVKEVTCLTILENGFGIVAVQELSNPESLYKLCAELNSPTIPNVKRWTGLRGHWECVVSEVAGTLPQGGAEYLGFLYDVTQDIRVVKSALLETTTGTNRPFVAHFEADGHELVVVNTHTEAEVAATAVSDIATKLDEEMTELKTVIIAGHLNLTHGIGSQLENRGYTGLNPSSVKNVNMVPICLLVNTCALDLHTGLCSEVTEGLTSPWIPNRWKWGGPVSDYHPVYAEFFTQPMSPHPLDLHAASRLSNLKLAAPLSGAGDCC